jgi:serine protease inhibitor ecotin
MGDRHTPYPNIEKDMEFTIVLIVKQKLENLFKSGTELIFSVWTLEINIF